MNHKNPSANLNPPILNFGFIDIEEVEYDARKWVFPYDRRRL